MITFYRTVDGKMTRLPVYSEGCWVSAVCPSEQEIRYLIDELGVDAQYVSAALDEEESSRIESEDGQTLVIIDVPYIEEEQDEKTILYTTTSIGIILTPANFITVSARETLIIDEFADGKVRGVQTHLKTRFLLAILLRVATRFQVYLKQIDRLSSATESQLHRSMQNKELFQLLGLEKSLVYFSTSLKANELTLEKILRGRIIKLYEDDQDLLEDVLIEIKQAIEMCSIYSGILSGTMDAFASIISNNLNIVMKILAAVTMVMAIPNIVFGFYGMNVVGFEGITMIVPLAVTLVLMALSAVILARLGMFKWGHTKKIDLFAPAGRRGSAPACPLFF